MDPLIRLVLRTSDHPTFKALCHLSTMAAAVTIILQQISLHAHYITAIPIRMNVIKDVSKYLITFAGLCVTRPGKLYEKVCSLT